MGSRANPNATIASSGKSRGRLNLQHTLKTSGTEDADLIILREPNQAVSIRRQRTNRIGDRQTIGLAETRDLAAFDSANFTRAIRNPKGFFSVLDDSERGQIRQIAPRQERLDLAAA